MLTLLMAVATSASGHNLVPSPAVMANKSFGVGRGFAVLVVLFALMLALMVLGGHLRASWQRRRRDKVR